jgi:threonine dehydrogenase-like Zn-dependent dehydrogenase
MQKEAYVKAAQMVAPRQIEMIDIHPPDISSEPAGTVLIKTHRSAICGTDMPLFVQDRPASDYPLGLGLSIHECIGVVAASKSARFKEGDEILALPRGSGGLAEYFLSHENVTVPLTKYGRKDCILMSQPLGTVIWACRKLGNLLNQDTVVVGQGPMGLLMTHTLSNLGAKTIIATDLLDYRLAVSKQMRATHTINAAEADVVAVVQEITKGRMADVVVEMVGHQTETINQCLNLVKRGGTILAFGVPDEPVYNFHFGDFFRKNIHFIGSVGPDVQNDFPLAMDMISQGRIDVSPIITHHLPFTEVQRGFELSLHKKDRAIKIILEYD